MFKNCRFSSFTLHLDRSSHVIKGLEINDEAEDKETWAEEFVDKEVNDVCSRKDHSVLERLLNASTSRTAIEISFILRKIAIDVKVKRRLKRKMIELHCSVSKFRSVNKSETQGPISQKTRSSNIKVNPKPLSNQQLRATSQDSFDHQQSPNDDPKLSTKRKPRKVKCESPVASETKTVKSEAVKLEVPKTKSPAVDHPSTPLNQELSEDKPQTIITYPLAFDARSLDSMKTRNIRKPIDFSTCGSSSLVLVRAQTKSTKKNWLPLVANSFATSRLRSMITGGSSTYGASQFSGQFQTPTTAAGSAAVNNFSKQQYEHSGQQANSSMSSQVANGYPNQMNGGPMQNAQAMPNTGHCMPPNYGGPNSMNPMNMNGMPSGYQQMNVMNQQSNARQQMAWNQQPTMMSNTPNEYLPIYRTPPVMNEPGMYGQQTQNIGMSATPPSSVGAANKKAGQKKEERATRKRKCHSTSHQTTSTHEFDATKRFTKSTISTISSICSNVQQPTRNSTASKWTDVKPILHSFCSNESFEFLSQQRAH
ncbi:hypothetical protein M3Y94_00814600 [Aphelenchoides besseyi]|nr:hypothetical protein M3Y94_00814600 [Aphelenchoides besseyi]